MAEHEQPPLSVTLLIALPPIKTAFWTVSASTSPPKMSHSQFVRWCALPVRKPDFSKAGPSIVNRQDEERKRRGVQGTNVPVPFKLRDAVAT